MHRARAVLLAGALACAACTGANPAYRGAVPAEDAQTIPADESPPPDSAVGRADTAARPMDAAPLPADAAAIQSPLDAGSSPDRAPDLGRDLARDLGPPPASLLAYWSFDDGPATGGAQDWSGRNHHGKLENLTSAMAWAPGRMGGTAFSIPAMPAATAPPPRARVDATPAIDGLSAFTISVWFYRTAVPANTHDPIISRQLGTSNNEVFNLTCNNHDLIIYIPPAPTGGSQVTFEVRAGNVCLPMTWVHAAATYNGTLLRLFVNGGQVGEKSFPNRLRSSPGAPVFIGANQNSNFVEVFEGLIDELALFSTALTPAQIADLHRGATPFNL